MLDTDICVQVVRDRPPELRQAFNALKPAERRDDAQVREMLRRALRKAMLRETGKKPLADIQVIRV